MVANAATGDEYDSDEEYLLILGATEVASGGLYARRIWRVDYAGQSWRIRMWYNVRHGEDSGRQIFIRRLLQRCIRRL